METVIKPAKSAGARRAFDELRKYHTRPLRLNWGPENVHFGKTHFTDPEINARILKIKKITRRNSFTFCVFHYGI